MKNRMSVSRCCCDDVVVTPGGTFGVGLADYKQIDEGTGSTVSVFGATAGDTVPIIKMLQEGINFERKQLGITFQLPRITTALTSCIVQIEVDAVTTGPLTFGDAAFVTYGSSGIEPSPFTINGYSGYSNDFTLFNGPEVISSPASWAGHGVLSIDVTSLVNQVIADPIYQAGVFPPKRPSVFLRPMSDQLSDKLVRLFTVSATTTKLIYS